MNVSALNDLIAAKMRAAGVASPTITAFLGALHRLLDGERGLLPEADVEPIQSLPRLEDLPAVEGLDPDLLRQLAVIKLNGGLGTSMGLERAKSLIVVKQRDTFLDFIARQVLHLRARAGGAAPLFYLMNSFSTRADTLAYLKRYPDLAADGAIDFLQNKVPKLDARTLAPVSWPLDPNLEWCPPGHGDLYPSLLGSGLLDELLRRGVRFLFVSNSDNLGATVDARLLSHFAVSGGSFLMEVAERTPGDRKGGHLARRRATGRLLLRESAQCPAEDEAAFQDIERHRFFNTNNLWLRLDHLRDALERHGGALPLPLITNLKTVDPRDAESPRVLQLESAMGAAVECFERSEAIVVPRSRFAPVKTTSDLLMLRSDAYRVTDDFRLVLAPERDGRPPVVDLDPRYYKRLADFERFFSGGVPSLADCDVFKVRGPVRFSTSVVCHETVEFVNRSTAPRLANSGSYRNTVVEL